MARRQGFSDEGPDVYWAEASGGFVGFMATTLYVRLFLSPSGTFTNILSPLILYSTS